MNKCSPEELKTKIGDAKYFLTVEEDLSSLESFKCPGNLGVFGWAMTERETVVWHKSEDAYDVTNIQTNDFFLHSKFWKGEKEKKLSQLLESQK
jgi:hypothetical protein